MYRFTILLKNTLAITILIISFLCPIFAEEGQKIIDFINKTAAKVIHVIESKNSNTEKQKQLQIIFCDTIDINWMGKFALGKYYRQLNKKELDEYLTTYKKFLINTYIPKFVKYNGETLYIESVKFISKSQYMVNTTLHNTNNSTEEINIIYKIKNLNNNQLQIRDIIAEDISLILGQRSDFNSIISQDGINILIQKLKNKVK